MFSLLRQLEPLWKPARETMRRAPVLPIGALVFLVMTVLAPGTFTTAENFGNILRAVSTDVLAAAGFTLVLLCGQLDLSIGSVMTTGGVTIMFLQPVLGWPGAIAAVGLVGAATGLFNGWLVTRAKIHSFIVTLGTMTILQGVNRALLHGGSKSLEDVAVGMAAADWLHPLWPWSPRVWLVFGPVLLLEYLLRRTPAGRSLYLIGGNPQAAWAAGIPIDRYITATFVLSGALSAWGGALTAVAQNTVMPNLGDPSLMLVVAAVIVGGTAMTGGRGSVILSVVALVVLNALTNGLSYLGATRALKMIANGAVLAAVIVLDAWRTARQNRRRGRRRDLWREFERLRAAGRAGPNEVAEMQHSDKTFAMVCVAAVACVAIVAIYALTLLHQRAAGPAPYPYPPQARTNASTTSHAQDVFSFKASDGQPLIWIDDSPLNPPPRPTDPGSLPEDHPLRWYDYEYAGWNVQKLPQPPSPGDGPRGKRVVSLQYMDHPYWTGYRRGMKRLADYYGIELTIMEAGNDNKVQADQVEQVIRMRPDLVILTPVDAHGVVPLLKRLYEERIPVIASNLLPVDEGMKYVITWTGPDDWGQFRMLAREFARLMGYQGDYCIIRHIAGTSCYLSRTWAVVSELKKVAPQMHCLDMQSTDLKTEETKTQVAAWLKKYGARLKGLVSADDSKSMVGIVEALADAGRDDIICVSAGTSRTGLSYIKQGKLHAVTYQSAESDGALPIEMAARWFRGEPITRPVYYLRKHIITAKDVDEFWPAQW